MKIGICNDHAGVEYKEKLAEYLTGKGHEMVNFGTDTTASMDYPDVAHPLATAVENGEVELGIAFCGTGNGMAMALNHHKSIRAGLCWSVEIGKLIKQHNNANVLVMPARFTFISGIPVHLLGIENRAVLAHVLAAAVGHRDEDGRRDTVIELAVREAPVFHKGGKVGPLGLIPLAVEVHHRNELIPDLFDDVARHLTHVRAVLQITARDVQRQLGAVDHPAQLKKILGDDLADVIRHKDLIVIQLDLSLKPLEIAGKLREEQNALEVQRIVGRQMHMEERLTVIVKYLLIKLLIFLIRAILGIF